MGRKLDNAKNLYLEGILEGRAREAVTAYTGDRYTQHSTGVRDGIEGFVEFFEDFLERNPVRDIRIVRGWEDGRYVFLQAYQNINDGEAEWVTTDFFDTDEDDRIVEHWDVIAAVAGPNPSGRTQIDGSTEIADLDRTEANKAVVRGLIADCLAVGATAANLADYIAADYLQHNPEVGDGRDHFAALVQDPDRPLNYDELVLCVGRGNFVATLCRANWNGDPLAQVDIFRLEDGKVVEHWDNSEPVPSPEESVNSGKF